MGGQGMSLRVSDLWVGVDGKDILKGVNLEIKKGERHVLFGPNGAGKSCLVETIMGIPAYKVKKGRIVFDDKDITGLPINERARLGIGLAFQNPPELMGVRLGELIRLCGGDEWNLRMAFLGEEFKDRYVNLGFSGGERKRSEIAQLFAMKPRLVLLDEIDSGVDVDSLEAMGRALDDFLSGRSSLIITHQGHILNYLTADVAHVLIDGRIVRSGEPKEILTEIRRRGFDAIKRA